MTQEKLFDAGVEHVTPRVVVDSTPSSKIAYKKYNHKTAQRPHKCDYCCLNFYEDPQGAPIPRKATHIRVAAGQSAYLCSEHTNQQRMMDQLPELRR